MIKLVYENHTSTFVFICDYCRKEIADPYMAMYAWRTKRDTSEPTDGEIHILHKGVCDYATTEMDTSHANSIYEWEWMELVNLPEELIKGMGLTWEQAQGQVGEYKQKDKVKIQLMKRELEEWKRSTYPLQVDNKDVDEGEDEE